MTCGNRTIHGAHNAPAVIALALIAPALVALGISTGCGKKDTPPEAKTEVAATEMHAALAPEAVPDVLRMKIPKVLDFGRGVCIPCKKMAPILNELAAEYRDRAVIGIIDIGEPGGRALSSEFKIQLIPTQIFFDAEGNEVWRHEGFLSREEIVGKLQEMGVPQK